MSLKNAFKVNFVKKCKIKNTLKYSISPKTHFILTDQRIKTLEKKILLHQNPNHNKINSLKHCMVPI